MGIAQQNKMSKLICLSSPNKMTVTVSVGTKCIVTRLFQFFFKKTVPSFAIICEVIG